MKHEDMVQHDFELIYSYTREQAISDGVLIDVSTQARGAGIKYPVAITARLWHGFISPDEKSVWAGQSRAGRLWDVLVLFALRAKNEKGSTFNYPVRFLVKGKKHKTVYIKAVCGPGDNAEPVITLMLPDED